MQLVDGNIKFIACGASNYRTNIDWIGWNDYVLEHMGEQGALAWDGEIFAYAPAYKVPVVDTTGAGDLFHAGFAYGLLCGWDLQHTLEFGCAAAGLNCKAHGARGGIKPVRTIERLRAGRKCYPPQYSLAALGRASERAHKARA